MLAPVAGLLVDRLEARAVLLTDSLVQALIAGFAGAGARIRHGAADRARDGVVFLFRDRTLGLVVCVVFVSLLFMTASATAEVFFLKDDLHVSDAAYGLAFATWTVGMVVGALVVARRVPIAGLALGVLVAVLVQGAGLGLPTAWLVFAFGASMWFFGGLGHGTKNVLARALIQQRVPSRLHGRAFAAYNGLRNGAELFALAGGGLLVAAIGARTTLALAGGARSGSTSEETR